VLATLNTGMSFVSSPSSDFIFVTFPQDIAKKAKAETQNFWISKTL
jgi:hypothetical protein